MQGVFYRATAREVAEALQLSGWVRNTQEGHVETMASGTEEQLQQFIDWCRQGPPRASVIDVQITYKDEEDFEGFRVIR